MNSSTATPPKPGLAAFAIAGALASGVGILATIARTKVLAGVVGPEGIGISAEVSQLVTLAMTTATIASGPALLKRIAEAERDGDATKLRRSMGAATGLACGLSVVGLVSAVIAAPHVLPHSERYPARSFVALAGTAAVIAAFTGVAQTLFVGTSNLRAITTLSIVPAILGTAVAVPLTLAFALTGQFVALALASLVVLGATLIYLRAGGGRARVSLAPALDWEFAKDAVVLGAAGLLSGYFGQLLFTTIRETLEVVGGDARGAAYNGNYQAATAIGNTYFTIVLGSLGTYFSPRYAAAKGVDELAAHVQDAQRFVLRVAPPIVLGAIAFRRDAIHLLYSDRFDTAISILGYQLAGDVAKGVSWATGAPLLVRGKVAVFVVTEGVCAGLCAAANIVLIRSFGPVGAGVAYLATYVFYAPLISLALWIACRVPFNVRAIVATWLLTLLALAVEWSTRAFPLSRWLLLPGLALWAWKSGALSRIQRRLSSVRSARAARG